MDEKPVYILTGASRGLGKSIAMWLAQAETKISLVARSPKELDMVSFDVNRLGGDAYPIVADIASEKVCHKIVEQTIERFGRLDGLINNAGTFEPIAKIASADIAAWCYNFQVNLLSIFYLTQFALPELKNQEGRIINVSSGAASHVIPAGSAYCAAKAALNQFTRVLADEERKIVTIAVRPGVVDTEMQALIREKGKGAIPQEHLKYYQQLKSEGQLEPPHIPARSIAWLALFAPPKWSGEFMSYDERRIFNPAEEQFGERYE